MQQQSSHTEHENVNNGNPTPQNENKPHKQSPTKTTTWVPELSITKINSANHPCCGSVDLPACVFLFL